MKTEVVLKELKNIRIEDYTYDLPDERIAKFPLARREASKLLIYRDGQIREQHFAEVRDVLQPGQTLIFNNTKVIHARIFFKKTTGAVIEIFCLEPYQPVDYAQNFAAQGECEWSCMVGNLKKWKDGFIECHFVRAGKDCTLRAEKRSQQNGEVIVHFSWDCDCSFSEVLEGCGRIPIPPYLNRESEESDEIRYQTVYSREEGSVAAPTAGLHFTKELLAQVRDMGVGICYVTLHVGLGTFRPVSVENVQEHVMHSEYFEITQPVVDSICQAKKEGHRVFAVGTTSVRVLETAASSGTLKAQSGWTDIFIYPGFEFRVVDALITNFHLPESTLMMLVSAFSGRERILQAYQEAVDQRYRFISFGDAMLLL